jgi:hypothetical protein
MRVTLLVVRNLSVAIVALASCAVPAHANWGRVTITPTATPIPLVEGCTDGANGAFVAWQEGSPTGVLRAKHLLATGAIDPAWPASGAAVCDVAIARSEVLAVPDRLGGAYLSWKEGNGLYVTRLDASGAVATGWPARGRFMGGVFADSPRPHLIEDGAHGIYLAWGSTTSTAVAVHLGPANTGAGGWPNSPRAISVADLAYNTLYWPQITLAPDGGLFVAYAVSSTDEDAAPSAWRLRRLTTAGISAAGWPFEGLSFGSFQRALLGSPVQGSLLATCPDGRGGAFLLIGNPVGTDPYYGAELDNRLYRIQGDGQLASDWPAGGRSVPFAPGYYDLGGSHPDFSYILRASGEEALLGAPVYSSEFITDFALANYQASWWSTQGVLGGQEIADDGAGGLFMANFYPSTEPYYYGGVGFISLRRTPEPPGWNDWTESHPWDYGTWYGDIGLASTEDGGAVLFWSQARGRVGLFAQQFNPSGAVTAVEPGASVALGLSRLRFVRGEGLRAAVSVPGGAARFELYDVAGRRLASQAVEPGSRELTLAGTSALPTGLYFGRLITGERSIAAKVMVAR